MSIAQQIAQYYGRGKEQKAGATWVTLCPCHADDRPSLSITDDNNGGVVLECHAGCHWKEIKKQIISDGLMPEWEPPEKPHHDPPKTPLNTSADKERKYYRWYHDAVHPSKDGYAWRVIDGYFSSRGIVFPSPSAVPPSIRLAEYHDSKHDSDITCIVCPATTLDDDAVYAAQRLMMDTSMDPPVKIIGKMVGNLAGRACFFDRSMDHEELYVCEGIETTLSIRQCYLDPAGQPTKSCAAALSTSLMATFPIPPSTRKLFIGVDSDKNKIVGGRQRGFGGQKAALALAERFESSGPDRKAWLITPDDSCFTDEPLKIDFNDLLKADRSGDTVRERVAAAVRYSDVTWRPPVTEKQIEENLSGDDLEWHEMLERYVFIQSENKILDTKGLSLEDSMMVVNAFKTINGGKFYRYVDSDGKPQCKPMAEYWLQSPKKKVVAAAVYRPGHERFFKALDGIQYMNSFRFAFHGCRMMSGDEIAERLTMYHELMDLVFHENKSYIEDWLCYTVQFPGERAQIMPIVISQVGLGKGTFMAMCSAALGFENYSNAKILEITELNKSGRNWGDWAYNKKLCCVDEVYPKDDVGLRYQVHEAMKDKITEGSLPLNLKGGRSITARVYVNMIGFSNYRDCMKIPTDDRRIYVVDSMGQERRDRKFYQRVREWYNDEKNAMAVYQYWLKRTISDEFTPGQAKMTKAKAAMQRDSTGTMQAAFQKVVQLYPSDLISHSELRQAVRLCMTIDLEDGEEVPDEIGKKDKQFLANIRAAQIVEVGSFRASRKGEEARKRRLLAIRNTTHWINSEPDGIKKYYEQKINPAWAHEFSLDGKNILSEEVPF